MALWHSFNIWQRVVENLTKQAQETPAAQYYMLYSTGPGRGLTYSLFESQEQLSAALVQSLDTSTEVHRVGEVSQLTGKRMFVWPNSLPKEVVWAVVHKKKRNDFGTGQVIDNLSGAPSPLPQLYFYTHEKVVLSRGIHDPIQVACTGGPTKQMNLREAILAEATDSEQVTDITKTEIVQFILNQMLNYGEFEHRWFGRVDISQVQKGLEKNSNPFEICRLHNIMLGDAQFN